MSRDTGLCSRIVSRVMQDCVLVIQDCVLGYMIHDCVLG